MAKHKYNLVRDEPDTRDFIYSAAAPIITPPIVDNSPYCSAVEDQAQTSSCTGNAIVGVVEYEENLEKETFVDLSRLFVYYNERSMEGDIAQDGGAQIRDGIKSVATLGICQESLWPFDDQHLYLKPTTEAYADALKHTALLYRRVNQTITDVEHVLASGHTIVVGISIYASFESDEVAKTGLVPMPDPHEECMGGHAVVVVGYDRPKRLFKLRNSWGPAWGNAGYFFLPYDYLLNPQLGSDFWTITKLGAGTSAVAPT